MWVSLPKRIPLKYTFLFALLLCSAELVEGTTGYIVGCVFACLFLATFAFNKAGGFSYPTGAYVFFVSTLTLFVGLLVKAVLGEPVQANLRDARASITIYLIGMAAMYLAVVFSRRFVRKEPFLEKIAPKGDQQRIALTAVVFGVVVPSIASLLGPRASSIFVQLNYFAAFGLLLAVYYRCKATNGRSSFTIPIFVVAIFIEIGGILSFSKQLMYTPVAAWVIAAAAAGCWVTRKQILVMTGLALFMLGVLAPYSQYGRSHAAEYGEGVNGAIYLLAHPDISARGGREIVIPGEHPQVNLEAATDDYHWFNRPMGIWDRLNMFAIDDGLFYLTNNGHVFGWEPLVAYFENTVPHVLWKDKPAVNFGNVYAHEMGILAEDDDTTGISFSPFGDAYHMGRWWGVGLVLPLILFMSFVVVDSVVGRTERAPWALIFFLWYAHTGPEGLLGAPVYYATTGLFSLLLAVMAMVYVMPVLSAILLGPESRSPEAVELGPAIQPGPGSVANEFSAGN